MPTDILKIKKCAENARAHLANLVDEIDIAIKYEGNPGWEPDIEHYEIHLLSAKASIGRAINIMRGVPGNEQEGDSQ